MPTRLGESSAGEGKAVGAALAKQAGWAFAWKNAGVKVVNGRGGVLY